MWIIAKANAVYKLSILALFLGIGFLRIEPGFAQAPEQSGSSAVVQPANSPSPLEKPKADKQTQCVKPGEERIELVSLVRPVGDNIVIGSTFIPGGQRVSVGIQSDYSDGARYFAYIHRAHGKSRLFKRQEVVTRKALSSDELVKQKLLDEGQTIVTLDVPDSIAGFWSRADLYLYTCGDGGEKSPDRVSRISVRISSYRSSVWICVLLVVLVYGIAAYASMRSHKLGNLFKSLNPVWVSVGPDGRASLSKAQLLLFSLIVFGLILLLFLQTGNLTEISGTVVVLLGIHGVGATIAKGTDTGRLTISPENQAWLLQHRWMLSATIPVDASNVSWRDFFTTNGELDAYRFQSFIFTIVVGLALIVGGGTQLSSFTVPENILYIVGLSQAVYIGGKLVTPTKVEDLNDAISDLRTRERKFRDAATTVKKAAIIDLAEAINLAGQSTYDDYKDRARDVAALFTDQTQIQVDAASLEPKLS